MEDRSDQRPCPAYTTPRLAAVYDALNPLDAVDAFYLRLAGSGPPLSILDAGCGTGRLACLLAERGHEVAGFDPAPAMLAIARSRPGGSRVDWIAGDATALAGDRAYDLVIMTGNVFQVYLTDEVALATLAAIRSRLSPQGRFAFETRNPAVREWLSWTPAETAEVLDVPGEGRTEVHYDIVGERDGIVTYDTHFAFADGECAVARSWLRFCPLDHVTALLDRAGLVAERLYGDWDESPFDAGKSPEIIIVARAA
jgi:SAM-dependent methyltransferase